MCIIAVGHVVLHGKWQKQKDFSTSLSFHWMEVKAIAWFFLIFFNGARIERCYLLLCSTWQKYWAIPIFNHACTPMDDNKWCSGEVLGICPGGWSFKYLDPR